MAKFIVQQGYDQQREIDITTDRMVIGREQDCDFIIPEYDVSRHHTLVTEEHGQHFLEDLESHNGTFKNNALVNERVQLQHQDVVQIGRTVLVFQNNVRTRPPEDESLKTQAIFTPEYLKSLANKIEANVCQVFKGDPDVVRNVLLCLMADSHVLIEDAPGVGKSILARSFSKSIQGVYKRIQFTPDMLPSDITGLTIYDDPTKEFRFMPGPIFGNVILADEINRTTPRTQSSLLECMSDAVVTIDGTSHVLPKPFFVIATQNPTEYHGTYPLPEAQLDRFLMRVSIGYPNESVELDILSSQSSSHPLDDISYVASANDLVHCQAIVRQVHVSEEIKKYIVQIAQTTREHNALSLGCSPRASLALMRASQSLAAYHGRRYVIPRDVRELVVPVLGHRISLKLRAQSQWRSCSHVLEGILDGIPVDDAE